VSIAVGRGGSAIGEADEQVVVCVRELGVVTPRLRRRRRQHAAVETDDVEQLRVLTAQGATAVIQSVVDALLE
jgi:hypothetical protein